ncbi:hypothetical protein QBC34DRAFT_450282 [Podospora aff. communis PSN243]|uniref:NmrA-like domain-containing protein n=1 Tax=Podospora aff. communis PSN243 TaxID=3040156 RepID=A0AAV9GHG9_9PEZI|nr:hypothetical protein QBC34DRAFT_450282 [Podospora aff. communis PSN243]
MAVIVVAGGLGDFGLLIVNALLETRKHVVYIMTRKRYNPIIQTDYSSEDALAAQLAERGVTLVICAFIMDNEKVCEAELRLIRAAEMTGTTTRFIPSEFNVEYDTPDSILPYPEKEYHMRARHELAMTTTLEYTYIYTGMFMDYFGMPKVPSTLRPLAFFIDPAHRKAVLPWGTLPKMSMTFSTDAARYIAYAIELKQWPRIMTTATGSINVRDILRQVEQNRDLPFQAVIVMDYRNPQVLGDETARDLPTNVQIARDYPERFPGGMQQVRELIANLELSVALGAYDFDHLDGHLDLAKLFKDIGPPAKRIEDVIKDAWGQGTAGLIRTYSQQYGFQEVLYNAISVAPGSPGLFLVGTAVTFSFAPSSGRERSAYDLVPLLRNAWLQVRQQYPTIAADNRPDCKVYTSPSSPAELEAWLDETFIVAPAKMWQDLYRDMVKTKHMTLYFCPEASQLFVQGEHHSLDGRGAVTLIEQFFRALASPVDPHDLWRTDGTEVSRLPPRTEDLLPMTPSGPGRAEQHAIELLTPLNTITSPICLPVPDPLPPPTMKNYTSSLKSDPRTTASISAACKSHRLSVTAAWHAAVILATQSLQSSPSPTTEPATEYPSFGNFDLRRYFPPSSPSVADTNSVSNHHTILPVVTSTISPDGSPKSFLDIAKELDTFYKSDLSSSPDLFPALPHMIRALIPGLLTPENGGSTPALSSLGVVDRMLAGEYTGQKGVWKVEDVWFGNTVSGPWLECFMWAWKGELVVSACWDGAFYEGGMVEGFLKGVVREMKGGLDLGVAVREKL